MAGKGGFGKIITSGLTMSFDVNDENSFKGPPTTNLVTDPTNMSTFSNYSCGSPVLIDTEFGTKGYGMYDLGSWNGRASGISLPSPGYYTFSCYFRYLGGSGNNNGGRVYTSGFGIGNDTANGAKGTVGEWIRYYNTQNCPGTSGTMYLISWGGTYCEDFSSWEMTKPQVEAGQVMTPWVDGSRTSTTSLLDTTGNNSLDVANVTFSSSTSGWDVTNNMEFDGTDDYLSLPNGILQGTGDFTICQVLQSSAGNAGGTTFGSYPSSNLQIFYGSRFIGMYLANNSTYLGTSPWSATLPEFTTNPTMLTAVRQGSTLKLYLDGVLVKTGSSTSTVGTSSTLFRIGANTAGSERFTGNIYTTQVYNRALNNEEILKNFKHYAKKYSIPIKDGSTSALAAPSAQHLADMGIKKDGVYWINNGTNTRRVYCSFKNGEGWMLVMNVKSDYFGDSNLTWNNYDNWINLGNDIGSDSLPFTTEGQYRNKDVFYYVPTTKIMIMVHNNGDEFGDESWAAWEINSTYSGQTLRQIMNIPGATGGGTPITNTYYAQKGLGKTTHNRGLTYCSIARTLGHLRVNHLLDNNGCRILGSEQTLETSNTDVTRGIGTHYAVAGTALTNTQSQWNCHVSPYVDGTTYLSADRRQFTDNIFPDNSNVNTATYQGLNVNPSLTFSGVPPMTAYYHYAIFIK